VGWYYPVMLSEEMNSRDDILDLVNSSGADFVSIRALGNQKGQVVQRNIPAAIPVRAHLGCTVNFRRHREAGSLHDARFGSSVCGASSTSRPLETLLG